MKDIIFQLREDLVLGRPVESGQAALKICEAILDIYKRMDEVERDNERVKKMLHADLMASLDRMPSK